MNTPQKLDRRTFLRLSGFAGSGLILGVNMGCAPESEPVDPSATAAPRPTGPKEPVELNAYVEISENNIVIYAPVPEIGQGAQTALPMMIAEELDAAWDDVLVKNSALDGERYAHQWAGGSRSIPTTWEPLRRAGATARRMLVEAASLRWEVDAAEVITRDSVAVHEPTGRELSYFELASAAAELPVPDPATIKLKSVADFRLLGTRVRGVDGAALVRGEPRFGIDQRLPEMLYATYTKCPAWGGVVKKANIEAVKQVPGVVDAFVLEGDPDVREYSSGVAIVATDTWRAFEARKALEVEWDESAAAKDSWSETQAKARALASSVGPDSIADKGDVDAAFAAAAKKVSGFYDYAFVSHAQMEPQNTTAWWHDGKMEIWAPTQFPGRAQKSVADVLGLAEDQVNVTRTRAGGGFGRRAINDPVVEAALIAQKLSRPVKLTWTREDDMAHDFYRAGGFHSLEGAVDADGKLAGWRNHFISFTQSGDAPVMGGNITADIDPGPFIENYSVSQTLLPWQTPCGPWRAPRSNVVAFAHQCFLHELSVAAGRDHVEFMLELLGEPRWLEEGNPRALHTGRAAGVIKLAAEKAGWGKPLPKGRGLGIAFYFSHAGHIAEAAEVSVDAERRVTVHRVTAAVDVGPIVNLSGAENQVQGSVVDGFSTMLAQQVTFEQGRAQELNFDTYPLLRMPRAPRVDVHFIQSDFPPTGLGEPALPPLAPAVGNAIFAASGIRVRSMPIINAGMS